MNIKLFSKKRYTLRFEKSYIPSDIQGHYREIGDGAILEALRKIREKYEFDIVSFKIKGFGYTSRIVIKCNKFDRINIFDTFIRMLGRYIEDVQM